MRRRRNSGSPLRIESLAGWVFADLLLVLFVVGLGTQVTQIAKADPTPGPEEPSPTVKVGMRQQPELVYLDADADALLKGSRTEKAEANRGLRKEIKKKAQKLSGEQAAMSLIFGCMPDDGDGQDLARAAGRQLERAHPKLFKGARERHFWDGSCDKGEDIKLEVYLYNTKPATE